MEPVELISSGRVALRLLRNPAAAANEPAWTAMKGTLVFSSWQGVFTALVGMKTDRNLVGLKVSRRKAR